MAAGQGRTSAARSAGRRRRWSRGTGLGPWRVPTRAPWLGAGAGRDKTARELGRERLLMSIACASVVAGSQTTDHRPQTTETDTDHKDPRRRRRELGR